MDKRELSESDIRTKFITPALRRAGWDAMLQIREEVSFTKGRITVRGKLAARGKAKRADLCEAVDRARSGLVDADLGGGVIKQRIARKGGGRSSGFRTIMLFRRGELAFFVYGFAKSAKGNLRRDELETFRRLADEYLALEPSDLAAVQAVGAIIEVTCDEQTVQE